MNYKRGIGTLPIIIILGIFIIGGFFLFGREAEAPADTSDTIEEASTTTESNMEEDLSDETSSEDVAGEDTSLQEVIVKYTNNGFSPQNIEIPSGTTVTFVNESSGKMWVATDVHPSHTVYPGSNISKCGTEEQSLLFDQCESIENGGSYSFKFTEVGEWDYHNHSKSGDGGTIVVK